MLDQQPANQSRRAVRVGKQLAPETCEHRYQFRSRRRPLRPRMTAVADRGEVVHAAPDSLLAGNLAGNFWKIGPIPAPWGGFGGASPSGFNSLQPIPCSFLAQGIFCPGQGIHPNRAGNLRGGAAHRAKLRRSDTASPVTGPQCWESTLHEVCNEVCKISIIWKPATTFRDWIADAPQSEFSSRRSMLRVGKWMLNRAAMRSRRTTPARATTPRSSFSSRSIGMPRQMTKPPSPIAARIMA